MLTTEQLGHQNPAYAKHAEHWDYLYRSYQGGEAYRAGEYLRPYLGESQSPGNQYSLRLQNTPLDNHVKSTIDVYRSFLFRVPPARVLGPLAENPFAHDFIADTDLDGQSMDSFIKSATDLALVMGNVWLAVDKPAVAVATSAQELELGIRAYGIVYAPQQVLDWRYERGINGKQQLTMIKVVEQRSGDQVTMRVWYTDRVERYEAKMDGAEVEGITAYEEFVNPLGYIPFINFMPERGMTPGVGNSVVADVADTQRSIYNKLSELEQNIRISGHPSLVKTAGTQATGGAGAIVTMPEDLPGDLKPYLLQPSGSSIDGILKSIEHDVEAINRMTHLSAVRATATQSASGVAMQVERQLLNSKLSDLADTIQETEIKLWKIWFDWQGVAEPAEFEIEYNHSFDLRDTQNDLTLYTQAKAAVSNAEFQQYLDAEIVQMMVDDEEELQRILDSLKAEPTPLPPLA